MEKIHLGSLDPLPQAFITPQGAVVHCPRRRASCAILIPSPPFICLCRGAGGSGPCVLWLKWCFSPELVAAGGKSNINIPPGLQAPLEESPRAVPRLWQVPGIARACSRVGNQCPPS